MAIKTLVLGGGFIGSHIADRAIELGHETFVLVRSLPTQSQFNIKAKYIIYNKSIFDSVDAKLELKEIDYIFNAFGNIAHESFFEGGGDLITDHFTNIIDFISKSSLPSLKCFVQLGSSDEYGHTGKINELTACHPKTPYAFSKYSATNFFQMLHAVHSFPVIIVRPFIIYGPKQKTDRLIPYLIYNLIKSREIEINNPNFFRDFCHINDFINALFILIGCEICRGEIFNIGSGRATNISDLFLLIKAHINNNHHEIDIVHSSDKSSLANKKDTLVSDIKKLKRFTGWSPSISIESGLQDTISWYLQREM